MCGIAGIASTRSPVERSALEMLGNAIAHRGPDGQGVWIAEDGRAGFVHQRLAIIDIAERANQPMHSADGTLTLLFNGEIFNFLELRETLEHAGHVFRTESDTEVLLAAWAEWGEEMLTRLNGMWAMAIRDNRSGSLFLARDRFGIKPLLYTHNEGVFAFASEMRALLSMPATPRMLDRVVARRLMFDPFSIEGSDRTLVAGIRRLPGGHWARLDGDRLTVRRWWATSDHLAEPIRDEAACVERFRELFFDATKIRMRSDVPIGTCLSGGFDSSAVVAAMAGIAHDPAVPHLREAEDWRHAFVAGFPGLSHDETPEARLAAQYAGIDPTLLDLSGDDGVSTVDAVLDALDDVYISLPAAPWAIYRAVRSKRVKVTLDGHGADEMIGAYIGSHNAGLAQAVRNLIGSGARRGATGRRAGEMAKLTMLRARGLWFARHSIMSPPAAVPIASQSDHLPDHWGPLNRRLYGMFHATTLPTILRNFDRLSMAHGVEVRMPFMDWRLVTFAMSLPETLKFRDGTSKWIARAAMKGRMPEEIRASRRKLGFNSQMPEWLAGSLGHWAHAVLDRPGGVFDELVDRPALARRVAAFNARRDAWTWDSTSRLWPYINLKWYIDRHGLA